MKLKSKKNNFIIKKVNINDELWILKLYNFYVRKKIFNSLNEVKLTEHRKWYAKAMQDFFLKLSYGDNNCGYIRIEKSNSIKESFEISIAIKNQYIGKGFGKKLLKTAISKFYKKKTNRKNKLIALVKKKNIISLNFFLKNNFKEIKIKNQYNSKLKKLRICQFNYEA